jgi:hypothetical protein
MLRFVCLYSCTEVIVGKFNTERKRERERESKRTVNGGQNSKARRILGKTWSSDK